MPQDTPPTDAEVLAAIAAAGAEIEPAQLISALCESHEPENVIEALQRAIERGKIALSPEGMILARVMAEAA